MERSDDQRILKYIRSNTGVTDQLRFRNDSQRTWTKNGNDHFKEQDWMP